MIDNEESYQYNKPNHLEFWLATVSPDATNVQCKLDTGYPHGVQTPLGPVAAVSTQWLIKCK